MIIKSRNLLHVGAQKTRTTHLEAAGTNVLRWENPNAFTASWAVQVGETGEEQTEVVLLGTAVVAGTAGTTTANTLYEHPADTPLYAIKYNQVVFERSTDGTAGTAAPMTSGTITYQPDHEFTQFDDTSGSTTYAYKTLFRNSVLAVNTTESDWITSAGFSFYSLANMRQQIKDRLWDADYIKDDKVIDNWINEWRYEMVNTLVSLNEDYALGTVGVGFGTAGLGTVTTADFKHPRRVWVTYNGTDKFQSTKMSVNDFRPDETFSSSHPYHYWEGNTVIGIRPPESGGTAEITFYRLGTTMVNDTDELALPLHGYTKSFVDYGEAMALKKDGKQDWKDVLSLAQVGKAQFVTQMTPRDVSGPQTVDLVEYTSGEDPYIIG